jgi:hypothetical protein
MPTRLVTLKWDKCRKMTEARAVFRLRSCIYVQADRHRRPTRVSKASMGLEARYHRGTAYALDAAMHHSGNWIFVSPARRSLCSLIEGELIRRYRRALAYNNVGLKQAPARRFDLRHREEAPSFPRTVV